MPSLLAAVIVAIIGLPSLLGSLPADPQVRGRLDPRIPAPIVSKYKDIRDGNDWLNPKMVIRSEGVEVVSRGIPGGQKTVPARALRDLVAGLPFADWPYGRVVMASDIGIRRGDRTDDDSIKRNHDAADQILKDLDVTADWWPSASPASRSRPDIALQLTSGALLVARLRARHRLNVPLAADACISWMVQCETLM